MNIPIFEALITDWDEGISKISLVDLPAVESNWLAFDENRVTPKFAIQDEEQRIIYGVLMRADYPIYRNDERLGEYYIQYSKETIKKMAEKLMVDGFQNKINLMHLEDTDVCGVNLMQLFIKDTEKGISPVGFEDIEEGSLFAQYKVENDTIWQMVKDGTFQGFSLEGCFSIERIKQNNTHKFMSTIKQKLAKILASFSELATDKGILVWEGEEAIAVGVAVTGEDDIVIADGEYTAEDGRIIVVAEGVVTEIKEPEEPAEEPSVEEVEEAVEVLAEEAPAEEPEAVEEPVEEPIEEVAEPAVEYVSKEEFEALKAELEAMKEQLAELANKPAVEPIVEEFEKVSHPTYSARNKLVDAIRKIK